MNRIICEIVDCPYGNAGERLSYQQEPFVICKSDGLIPVEPEELFPSPKNRVTDWVPTPNGIEVRVRRINN